jgi:hypothetical protein
MSLPFSNLAPALTSATRWGPPTVAPFELAGRLAMGQHLFNGALQTQLHPQQGHVTVIRSSAWP